MWAIPSGMQSRIRTQLWSNRVHSRAWLPFTICILIRCIRLDILYLTKEEQILYAKRKLDILIASGFHCLPVAELHCTTDLSVHDGLWLHHGHADSGHVCPLLLQSLVPGCGPLTSQGRQALPALEGLIYKGVSDCHSLVNFVFLQSHEGSFQQFRGQALLRCCLWESI